MPSKPPEQAYGIQQVGGGNQYSGFASGSGMAKPKLPRAGAGAAPPAAGGPGLGMGGNGGLGGGIPSPPPSYGSRGTHGFGASGMLGQSMGPGMAGRAGTGWQPKARYTGWQPKAPAAAKPAAGGPTKDDLPPLSGSKAGGGSTTLSGASPKTNYGAREQQAAGKAAEAQKLKDYQQKRGPAPTAAGGMPPNENSPSDSGELAKGTGGGDFGSEPHYLQPGMGGQPGAAGLAAEAKAGRDIDSMNRDLGKLGLPPQNFSPAPPETLNSSPLPSPNSLPATAPGYMEPKKGQEERNEPLGPSDPNVKFTGASSAAASLPSDPNFNPNAHDPLKGTGMLVGGTSQPVETGLGGVGFTGASAGGGAPAGGDSLVDPNFNPKQYKGTNINQPKLTGGGGEDVIPDGKGRSGIDAVPGFDLPNVDPLTEPTAEQRAAAGASYQPGPGKPAAPSGPTPDKDLPQFQGAGSGQDTLSGGSGVGGMAVNVESFKPQTIGDATDPASTESPPEYKPPTSVDSGAFFGAAESGGAGAAPVGVGGHGGDPGQTQNLPDKPVYPENQDDPFYQSNPAERGEKPKTGLNVSWDQDKMMESMKAAGQVPIIGAPAAFINPAHGNTGDTGDYGARLRNAAATQASYPSRVGESLGRFAGGLVGQGDAGASVGSWLSPGSKLGRMAGAEPNPAYQGDTGRLDALTDIAGYADPGIAGSKLGQAGKVAGKVDDIPTVSRAPEPPAVTKMAGDETAHFPSRTQPSDAPGATQVAPEGSTVVSDGPREFPRGSGGNKDIVIDVGQMDDVPAAPRAPSESGLKSPDYDASQAGRIQQSRLADQEAAGLREPSRLRDPGLQPLETPGEAAARRIADEERYLRDRGFDPREINAADASQLLRERNAPPAASGTGLFPEDFPYASRGPEYPSAPREQFTSGGQTANALSPPANPTKTMGTTIDDAFRQAGIDTSPPVIPPHTSQTGSRVTPPPTRPTPGAGDDLVSNFRNGLLDQEARASAAQRDMAELRGLGNLTPDQADRMLNARRTVADALNKKQGLQDAIDQLEGRTPAGPSAHDLKYNQRYDPFTGQYEMIKPMKPGTASGAAANAASPPGPGRERLPTMPSAARVTQPTDIHHPPMPDAPAGGSKPPAASGGAAAATPPTPSEVFFGRMNRAIPPIVKDVGNLLQSGQSLVSPLVNAPGLGQAFNMGFGANAMFQTGQRVKDYINAAKAGGVKGLFSEAFVGKPPSAGAGRSSIYQMQYTPGSTFQDFLMNSAITGGNYYYSLKGLQNFYNKYVSGQPGVNEQAAENRQTAVDNTDWANFTKRQFNRILPKRYQLPMTGRPEYPGITPEQRRAEQQKVNENNQYNLERGLPPVSGRSNETREERATRERLQRRGVIP